MKLRARRHAERQRETDEQARTVHPEPFDSRPLRGRHASLTVQYILTAGQEQRRQHRQHRDQAQSQAAAGDDAHLLDAFEIGEPHRQERRRGRQRPRHYPLPREHHRGLHRLLRGAAAADFLLVTRDEMHAEVNRKADEDRGEGDRQDVQMPDHQRREPHRVTQAHHEAGHGFERPPRSLVGVNEDERAKQQ